MSVQLVSVLASSLYRPRHVRQRPQLTSSLLCVWKIRPETFRFDKMQELEDLWVGGEIYQEWCHWSSWLSNHLWPLFGLFFPLQYFLALCICRQHSPPLLPISSAVSWMEMSIRWPQKGNEECIGWAYFRWRTWPKHIKFHQTGWHSGFRLYRRLRRIKMSFKK